MVKGCKVKGSKENLIEKKDKNKIHGEAFITKDEDLIRQYYELRNRVFSTDGYFLRKDEKGVQFKSDKWSKIEHDEDSEIIVILDGDGKVVAGQRLTFSFNGELLSDEYEGTEFLYENLLKDIKLDCKKKYCQADDLAIEKSFRNRAVLKDIIVSSLNRADILECSYVFCVAPIAQCRLIKLLLSKYCKDVVIFEDRIWKKLKDYNYAEDNPIVIVI